jgi:tellurite resistance-related uncharacterized protein
VPAGLLRSHRLADGTWGQLVVLHGRLGFRAATDPPTEIELQASDTHAIPPGMVHEVQLLGPVEFAIDFYATPKIGAQG